MPTVAGPRIHLAFRFHVNLYHSYRGDSLDEKGIGKDLRIIRGILDDLDALNVLGIPVRAAWDIENHYSLELYLPRHAPVLLDRIRGRVDAWRDEVEPMSWNNGLATAHTRDELDLALRWAISNPRGSGLADRFGSFAPVCRPQECMFSASQIPVYRRAGLEAVSVFYSACPFNGFGSFVAPLPLAQRYNPLTLRDPASGETIRLLPAYSPADLVEHGGSLRRWLRRMRREQLLAAEPRDLLLLIDMDADDTFWEGYLPKAASALLPSLCGLLPLVRSVADLPWLVFSRPWDYLLAHADAGEVSFGQDLADGSFDGYSSWAEKGENARLWPEIAKARRSAGLAGRIAAESGRAGGAALDDLLRKARAARLLALSTTHFGMASPVMNVDRLRDAFARADAAVSLGQEALSLAQKLRAGNPQDAGDGADAAVADDAHAADATRAWYFDPRIDALPLGNGVLPADRPGDTAPAPGIVNPNSSRVERLEDAMALPTSRTVECGPDFVRAGDLELRALPEGGVRMTLGGEDLFELPLSRPWVRYAGEVRGSGDSDWARDVDDPVVVWTDVADDGSTGQLRVSGSFSLGGSRDGHDAVHWTHTYRVAAGLPTVAVQVMTTYPRTKHEGFRRGRAQRLGRTWDARFREVAPFELHPALGATKDSPVRVWKHGFDDSVACYDLDYHRFGPNAEPDSLDNHVTDGWVAVSGPTRGLLVAQSDVLQTLYAFCPMRVRFDGERQGVRLNPFGSYSGKQWRYPTATTGLGRLAALLFGDNFDAYAPSWEGDALRCSLLIAPYAGGRPPEALQRDALLFAQRPVRA